MRPSKSLKTSSQSSGSAAIPRRSKLLRKLVKQSFTIPALVLPSRAATASILAIISAVIRTGMGWVSATAFVIYKSLHGVEFRVDIVYHWYTVAALKAPKTKPVPIRLDADLARRLNRAAKRLGACRSSIVRLSILNQLPEIEAGHISLRPMKESA